MTLLPQIHSQRADRESGRSLRLVGEPDRNVSGASSVILRANLARRMCAAAIDRFAPLPLIAWFFPGWVAVVVGYHVLCDSTPNRRSFGKWICRLRVASVIDGPRCRRWQAIVRRLGVAATQAAYCYSYEMFLVALCIDLIGLTAILLSAAGRRPEDIVAGTQVVTESTYQRLCRK
jgi:uncharacterized RDD family membrane protein YckC